MDSTSSKSLPSRPIDFMWRDYHIKGEVTPISTSFDDYMIDVIIAIVDPDSKQPIFQKKYQFWSTLLTLSVPLTFGPRMFRHGSVSQVDTPNILFISGDLKRSLTFFYHPESFAAGIQVCIEDLNSAFYASQTET